MTRCIFGIRHRLLQCAAIFAAYFFCVTAAFSQDVTFRTADNAVVVEGRFIGFDGAIVTLSTREGLVSFRADGMACGSDENGCPDLVDYVPTLRILGAAQMVDILMPALIEVYGRDRGWNVAESPNGFSLIQQDGPTRLDVLLSVADAQTAFRGFANHDADMLLSMRELNASELSAATQAGLGRLNSARQGRILALDALVPVTSPSSDLRSISLAELTKVLSTDFDIYELRLASETEAQIASFEDRFMRPFGLTLRQTDLTNEDLRSVLDEIETSDNGLSLVPFGATRNTQPLALSGPCGLQSRAEFLSMKTEDYPLTFPLYLYLPQRNLHPQIDDFLNWLRSPAAQLVIRRAGFVDLSAVPIPLSDQGDRLASAITNAGPEIPLVELQRMVRVLSSYVRMTSTFRFEAGSTRLDGQSRSNIMQLAQAIRDGRFANRELLFVGFSDGRGPASANRDLSAARAESVRRDVQRALGEIIPSNVSIDTAAFGEALPMACDDTIWGQQTNRRVELWVRDAD